jgi:hypothetical protein
MKRLSSFISPLPSLAVRGTQLTECVQEKLRAEMLMPPGSHIGSTYWKVVEQLHACVLDLDFEGLSPEDLNKRKRDILSRVEMLMQRCASLNDYLGQLLQVLLPKGEGKKNRGADTVKRRLDARVNRLFKMPINLVKHNGFELLWIQMYRDDLVTHGYTVQGPLADGVIGPIKFRRPNSDDPEGYSFALALREVLPSIYLMCDITEQALAEEGLFEGADQRGGILNDARQAQLAEALEALNKLPRRAFPDEAGVHVPIFEVKGHAVFAQTRVLRSIPGTFRITSEIGSVAVGSRHQMPYWQGRRMG